MKRHKPGQGNHAKKVYLIDDRELHLDYEDVEQYQKDMITFILPNDVNVLMDHVHQLHLFIDEVHRITDRKKEREKAKEQKRKKNTNNNNNNNNNNNDEEEEEEIFVDRFAFLDSSNEDDDDDNEISLKPKDVKKVVKKSTKPEEMVIEDKEEESTLDIEEDDEEDEWEYTINYGATCNIIWNWYSAIRSRNENTYHSLYVSARFYMWVAFSRMFYLTTYTKNEKHDYYTKNMVDKMPYFRQIQKYCYIEVSQEVIGSYSINELWSSVRLTYRSLYNFSYTDPMKDFFHALFYRYTNFVSCEQVSSEIIFDNPNFVETNRITLLPTTANTTKSKMLQMMAARSGGAGGGGGGGISMNILGVNNSSKNNQQSGCDWNDGTCDIDGLYNEDPSDLNKVNTVTELVEAFKLMSIKANDKFSINNQFIMEGEKLFYHQIYRLRISSRLNQLVIQKPLNLNFTRSGKFDQKQFTLECIGAWKDFMISICEDKKLRTFMIGEFKQKLVDIHMYHGEKERYCEAFPDMADDFREILREMRADDLSYIEKTQLMTLRDIIESFYKELTKTMEHSLEVNYRSISYELECILLTILGTKNWYQSQVVPSASKLVTNMVYDELCKLEDMDNIVRTIGHPTATKKRKKDDTGSSKKSKESTKKKQKKNGKKIVVPVTQKKKKPLFIKLMRIYYVVNNEGAIYTSFSFIESFMVWSTLCVKYRFVENIKVHPTLRKIINKISPII